MKQCVIPTDATEFSYPDAKLVVYYYAKGGSPLALIYKGRQSKAKYHYRFASVESRDAQVERLVAEETRHEAAKNARQNAGHGLVVGDILYCTWGYDQTNADFYRVVRVPPARSVAVVGMPAKCIENPECTMTGWASPDTEAVTGDARGSIRRAIGPDEVSSGCRYMGALRKWHGRPVAITWYA